MDRRSLLLDLVSSPTPSSYIPAGFFLHFDPAHQQGQAAIDRHLEFFEYTDMDFVKIQYEQLAPSGQPVRRVQDWRRAPRVDEAFFTPTLEVVDALVRAAGRQALVLLTLYSPLMWAVRVGQGANLAQHLREDPNAVVAGLEIMTENVLTLARAAKRLGVDGFYASSQGGEAFRFPGANFFHDYIRPTDLAVWNEIQDCPFNVLHVCDYEGGYSDLTPFQSYPGTVANASLKVGQQMMSLKEAAAFFGRPFMGGLERKGVIAGGSLEAIRQEVAAVLAQAPDRFILAADCTVPGDTPWENLRTAIDVAHRFRG